MSQVKSLGITSVSSYVVYVRDDVTSCQRKKTYSSMQRRSAHKVKPVFKMKCPREVEQ